jgi:hypothetical protein
MLLAAAMARATSLIPIPLDELSRRASVIVEARAADSWSAWNADHSRIFTFTRFEVARTLKGGAGEEIVVRQMGGQVGHIIQRVSGVHYWLPGEERVLFLRPSEAGGGAMSVVGLIQGDFRIRTLTTGERLASNGVPQVKIYSPEAQANSAVASSGTEMPLAELEARVKEALR